jgi:hypothetical protein
MKHLVARFCFPIVGILVLILLVFFGIYGVVEKNPDIMAVKMHKDLEQLAMILQKVDKDCSIISVDKISGVIDFLTLEKPLGIDVGCLTLAYPEKWTGPYLKKNLMYQETYYEIVEALDGFYIVPGDGTRLPNGFVMGTDIEISSNIELEPLLKPGALLCYKNSKFAVPLLLHNGHGDDVKKIIQTPDSLLKEFNAVMPFVKNFKEPNARQSAQVKNQC